MTTSTTTQSSSGGISFGGLLFIVFLVLKLTGVITWSWLWVTAPLWIPLGLALVIFGAGFVAVLAAGRSGRKRRR